MNPRIGSMGLAGWGLALVCGCGGKVRTTADPLAPSHAQRPANEIAAARAQAATDPKQPYWPFHVAELCVAADSLSRAEASLRASLAIDPNYAPALSLLSKLYFDSKRHAEAVQLLTDAQLTFPGKPAAFPAELLAGLALHYDALGETGRSADIAAQIRERSDARKSSGSALAYVALRGEAASAALELAKSALDANSNSAVNLNNYGVSRLLAGDPTHAREAFLEAIDKDSKLPGPYYNLALVDHYYFLNHASASKWWKAYWSRSHEDPDGLAETFASEAPKEATGRVASAPGPAPSGPGSVGRGN